MPASLDEIGNQLATMLPGLELVRNTDSTLTVGADSLANTRGLLDRAVVALEKEDRWLNRAFARSSHQAEYAARGPAGVAYWVFEHNLVFAIFREWLTTHRVLWDETTKAEWARPLSARERPSSEKEAVRRKYIDLQVLDGASAVRVLFEAKWFNTGKAVQSAASDWRKLVDLCEGKTEWSAYTLLFACGSDNLIRGTFKKLAGRGLPPPSFAGVFPTRLDDGDGYFALFAVPAKADPDKGGSLIIR